jgi:hypothetical protein
MKTVSRFTLEEKIYSCWNVIEDIDVALRITEKEDTDSIQNALIGIKELYTQKFEELWEVFEIMIHEKKID